MASTAYSDLTIDNIPVSIANGATTSGEIDLGNRTLCGIHLPAAFTGTALSFTVSTASGGTFQTLQKGGADYSITVAQGKYVALSPSDFAGARFIKIVSGTAQEAARSIVVAARIV